ncbi:Hsp20/alpha crystallin family protein [Domibacillus tundrae]|uniref:Hsp20/alpha crystallin family protein n=1 Tax=Domibacillus tundrae TaxID=1587527 RepID=UPI000617BB61|nr:Hsp20/alpha crystallin family protein [Domibacillus tundrae]
MKPDKNNLPSLFDGSFNHFIKTFDSFFDEPFRHFDDFLSRDSFSVNVHETANDVVIEAELPGCKRDQIQVEILRNDRLRILVENDVTTEVKKDENIQYYKKRAAGKMERIIQLPFPVTDEAPKATCRDGLLKVVLKKGKRRFVDIE